MMISPGTYVCFHLEGKSEEEANREIKKLRQRINHLKRVIEEFDPCSDEIMEAPSPGVRLSCSRDYLDAAREYFESRGWEYKPSRAEIADKKFNDRLKDLESIRIEYDTSFDGKEIRTITFDGEKILVDRDLSLMLVPHDEKNRVFFKDMTKDDLLDELAELHIGEWVKKPKPVTVLDGIRWSVVFKYSDGKSLKYEGNITPYNFDDFLDAVQMERIDDPEVKRRMFEGFDRDKGD